MNKKKERLDPREFLGRKLRMKGWSECFFLVVDIGHFFLIGNIFTHEGLCVERDAVLPINADWVPYIDAEEFIAGLDIKK